MQQRNGQVTNAQECKVVVLECFQAKTCHLLAEVIETAGYRVYRGCDPEVPEEAHRVHLDVPCLTEREVEVLQILCDSNTAAAAAEKLHLTENSVRRHLANIRSKLSLESTIEVIAWAFRKGLIH